MKSLYKVIVVYVLISIGTTVKAQYFDWVRSYNSCSINASSRPVNQIIDAVADSQGNVYVVGHFMPDAQLSGEFLLPIIPFGSQPNSICTGVMKFSPNGRLLWHKALWKNKGQNHNSGANTLFLKGDSVLVFYGCFSFSPDQDGTGQHTYYWDTLLQGTPFKGDSVGYGNCTGILYLNLEDGSIKEQHFLNAGYNDTTGNPIYFYRSGVASHLFGGGSVTIDHEGNIIMLTRTYESIGTIDPITHTAPHYAWERGEIGAMRIMVDGERSFYVHSNSCPRPWNFLLVKFSPHFDSLLAARFLFEPSNVPVDFNPNDIHVPPSDPSYPREAYRAYNCNDNHVDQFAVDEENNLYVVGSFSRCGYTANDTLIPVDSAAGMYLSVNMIPSQQWDSVECPSLPVEKGYLIKFDSQLRPLYLKQLDWAKTGKQTISRFECPNITDSGIIVPMALVLGTVSDIIPDKYYLLDGDTLPRWLTNSASYMRLDRDDGHLLAYGGLHVVGNWEYRYAEHAKELRHFGPPYAARNNRFASGISMRGDILFANSLHRYNFQNAYEKVSAMVIWDYSGHEILYMELSGVDRNYRSIVGALFNDSSLYIYGNLADGTQLRFSDTTLIGSSCTTAFIARYVDTAFLRPYVHPVTTQDTQQMEEIRVMVQDDIGCLVAYPNPFRQRVRVRYHGTERLREAFLTDMQGRRERVTLAPVGEGEYSLDFSHLPPAPYLLTLVTHSGKQITARLHSAR